MTMPTNTMAAPTGWVQAQVCTWRIKMVPNTMKVKPIHHLKGFLNQLSNSIFFVRRCGLLQNLRGEIKLLIKHSFQLVTTL